MAKLREETADDRKLRLEEMTRMESMSVGDLVAQQIAKFRVVRFFREPPLACSMGDVYIVEVTNGGRTKGWQEPVDERTRSMYAHVDDAIKVALVRAISRMDTDDRLRQPETAAS